MIVPGFGEEERHLNRELITPEGVPLTVTLASWTDRLGAAFIDLFVVINGTALVVLIISLFVPGLTERSLAGSAALFIAFVLRLVYYPVTELSWRGQTLGKRLLGLRVVGRDGTGLTAEAEIVRSLMREIELWLPVSLILSLSFYSDAQETWSTILACLFLAVICAIPLLNRDVMRAGDMLAGTWVVSEAKAALLPDLTTASRTRDKSVYSFDRRQLDAYGIRELETLAHVLRDATADADRLQRAVAVKIQKKIGFPLVRDEQAKVFLMEYYRALRKHLEQKLVFGKRRLSKYDID